MTIQQQIAKARYQRLARAGLRYLAGAWIVLCALLGGAAALSWLLAEGLKVGLALCCAANVVIIYRWLKKPTK